MNKKILIIVLFLVIVAAAGGYFVLSNNKSSKPQEVTEQSQEEVIPTIAPSELGFTVDVRSDKKAVKFSLENIKDISSVDYEISYLAKGNIPRGAIGHVEVKEGASTLESNYIDLGSCSSGKCKYDEGVTSVKVILKINKTDGKVYQSEKSAEI